MVVLGGRVGRIAVAMVLALGSAIGPGAASISAADPSADGLQGTFVDVATIPPPPGSSSPAPVRLLAVRAPDPTRPGDVDLVVLGAVGSRWVIAAQLRVATGLTLAGPGRLVGLDQGFGLIASDGAGQVTFVATVTVEGSAIQIGTTTSLAAAEVESGAADVVGDGSHELILIARASPEDFACVGRTLIVLDPVTLAPRGTFDLGPIAIDGAAIGRFGPGRRQGLVAYTHESCGAGTVPSPDAVTRIDLQTGHTAGVLNISGYGVGLGPLVPLIADLDHDGIDEPIVRSGPQAVVLDPAHGWSAADISDYGTPFGVVDPTGRPRLVVDLSDPNGGPSQIGLVAISRVGRARTPVLDGIVTTQPPVAGRVAIPGIEQATDPSAAAPVWIGDVAGDGCTELVVPTTIFSDCPGDPAWSVKPGPALLQTTPLLAYGDVGSRRLLVAAGTGWATSLFALAVPSPALSGTRGPGAWRSGPSAPFALQLLDASDIGYFTLYPSPAVDIDPELTGDTPPRLILGGAGGDRIFVRLTPTGSPDPTTGSGPLLPPTPAVADAGDYLISAPTPDSRRTSLIPVPDASTAGANPGFAFVGIPDGSDPATSTTDPAAATASAWTVEALSLNAFGEPSSVVSGRVSVDRVGPNIVIEPPFVSAPWPFSAPIQGITEPGARIRLGDRAYVDAARNGTFEVRTQLAPWPQDLVVEGVDARGNRTTVTVSVVGGLDYRRLPWQAVLISGILLGAAITTWGGPSFRRRRSPAPALASASPHRVGGGRPIDGSPALLNRRARWQDATAEATAEIEDLPPTRVDRSD